MKDRITPWPAPEGAPALLVGGTFDPVHEGHVAAATSVRDALPGAGDRWILFTPASRSPHKDDRPGASAARRADMLRLAVRDHDRAAVWTDEIDRADNAGEAGYWIDTLRRARSVVGEGVDLRFMIGADQAASFHAWKKPREILELAEPAVVVRELDRSCADIVRSLEDAGAWSGEELARWRRWIVEIPTVEVSATRLRSALGAGETGSIPGLDPRVAAYIRREGLYLR